MKKQQKTETPQNVSISSLSTENPRHFQNFFMESKANFNESDVTASTCYRNAYNDFSHQNPKRNEPKANPIRTQFKPNFCLLRPSLCFLDWILLLYEPRLRYSVWGATYAANQ